ncbi:MAG: NUDIX hydrolase [Patescibacteria group bacterium]
MIEVRLPPPSWYPFHDDKGEEVVINVSSVGIWVFSDTHFLAVQQADVLGKPWGIPAGSVESFDKNTGRSAIRELLEEAGLESDPRNLPYLGHRFSEDYGNKGQILFAHHRKDLGIGWDLKYIDARGQKFYNPPPAVNRSEIEQLALIPLVIACNPNNVLLSNPYHIDKIYDGLLAMRRAEVIDGHLPIDRIFDSDPGL